MIEAHPQYHLQQRSQSLQPRGGTTATNSSSSSAVSARAELPQRLSNRTALADSGIPPARVELFRPTVVAGSSRSIPTRRIDDRFNLSLLACAIGLRKAGRFIWHRWEEVHTAFRVSESARCEDFRSGTPPIRAHAELRSLYRKRMRQDGVRLRHWTIGRRAVGFCDTTPTRARHATRILTISPTSIQTIRRGTAARSRHNTFHDLAATPVSKLMNFVLMSRGCTQSVERACEREGPEFTPTSSIMRLIASDRCCASKISRQSRLT